MSEDEMLSEDELKRARELCEAATPGPWRQRTDLRRPDVMGESIVVARTDIHDGDDASDQEWADSAFISASRTLVPALLDEIDRLRAQVGEVEQQTAERIAAWLDAQQIGGSSALTSPRDAAVQIRAGAWRADK